MTSYQVQTFFGICGHPVVAATTKVLTSCGEDLFVSVDGLAVAEDENHV